jgi:hypothetical protein
MKIIKIMPEFDMSPLWLKESANRPYENVSINSLDISNSLIARIIEWDSKYQQTFNEDYPPDSGFTSTQEEEKFEECGMTIWQDLKSELSNKTIVIYYSPVRNKLFED